MYTILWREGNHDRWDRLETEEEVRKLLDQLAENSEVSEGDIWIFSPEADKYALDYYGF